MVKFVGLSRRSKGRILAVKLGYNPNSSSLGADVTFLIFGATALSMALPVLGQLARWQIRRKLSKENVTQ